MKKVFGFLIICLFLVFSVAMAETAQEITDQCTFWHGKKKLTVNAATDRNYGTKQKVNVSGYFQIDHAEGEISAVYVKYHTLNKYEIQVQHNGKWQTVLSGKAQFNSEVYELPEPAQHVRIRNLSKDAMAIAEVYVYADGELPADVQRWHTIDKSDLMLFIAHPDDELLWFAGLLPTYAGERQLDVQVLYATKPTDRRQLEMLDAVWHCGVTAYPESLGLKDIKHMSLNGMYNAWGRKRTHQLLIAQLRKHQPEVLVTQDFKGEYGHGAHQAVADASSVCLPLAADRKMYVDSAKLYGTWQVKKLYIHRYEGNQHHIVWDQPLAAFGGKDGLTIADEAMRCHTSQTEYWSMAQAEDMDYGWLGLYYSAVGPDDLSNDDLMQNIPLAQE